jgi:hypothetical protein
MSGEGAAVPDIDIRPQQWALVADILRKYVPHYAQLATTQTPPPCRSRFIGDPGSPHRYDPQPRTPLSRTPNPR